MKKIIVTVIFVIVVLLVSSFLPLWTEKVKGDNNYIKVDFWTKIQSETGQVFID